jgi:hypothetical protein
MVPCLISLIRWIDAQSIGQFFEKLNHQRYSNEASYWIHQVFDIHRAYAELGTNSFKGIDSSTLSPRSNDILEVHDVN